MKKYVKNCYRNIRGIVIPTAALLSVALVSLCGIGVDISYYGILRSSVEKATEASSVAGAQEYFRSMADSGRAVNATLKVFKMNVSNDTMVDNYYSPTGPGNPSTLTYSKTFTTSDGISTLFRGSPVTVTIMTDLNRGKISVESKLTAKPFFAQILGVTTEIKVSKEAELPPYDVVFVNDLSGSMRFATFYTYVGIAWVQMQGLPGFGQRVNNVILCQSQSGCPGRIDANGLVVRPIGATDVLINSPGVDIPTNATYTTGMAVYINDADRGWIVNSAMSNGLRRTSLSGFTINQLANLNLSAEDMQLSQTFLDNRSLNGGTFTTYFNRAAQYIEPHASAAYGVSAFINTVRMYGAAALKLALITFQSSSSIGQNEPTNIVASGLRANGISKLVTTIYPFVDLVDPSNFNDINTKLTIMSLNNAPNNIRTYSYPEGGTNISAGLTNAQTVLNRSDRPNSEKIIVLFTDGEPTAGDTFSRVGTTVKSLTDSGIKVYSIVLTLAITQNTIDAFKQAVEVTGMAEPVIFINDPASLKNAFLQIADELGLKLVR